jgi:hypothetical protein
MCRVPYNPVPAVRLERVKHPLGLPTDRTICAKPKGERSIWQSSERKVDGVDHVAHSHACRFLGECSLPGSFRCFGNRQGGAIK